jgi:integrase
MSGLRCGELCGLRWKDVDLDGARLSVRQTLLAVGHEVSFSEPKTDQSRRSVSLDPQTVAVLKAWRKRQLEERPQGGPDYRESELVFTAKSGGPIHPDFVSKSFVNAVRSAGAPPVRFHDLRHSHASLLAAKVHPKVVSERLGHSSITLTLDVYSHLIPPRRDRASGGLPTPPPASESTP